MGHLLKGENRRRINKKYKENKRAKEIVNGYKDQLKNNKHFKFYLAWSSFLQIKSNNIYTSRWIWNLYLRVEIVRVPSLYVIHTVCYLEHRWGETSVRTSNILQEKGGDRSTIRHTSRRRMEDYLPTPRQT